jgi:hypothetical protein
LTQQSGGAIGPLTFSGHGLNVFAGDDAIFIDQTLLALGARPSAAQISTALGQPDMQAASLAQAERVYQLARTSYGWTAAVNQSAVLSAPGCL